MQEKRLFITDLPESVNESELNNIFSKYGTVGEVEIKERKNLTVRNISKFFAYVTLQTDPHKLQKCFQHFNTNNWRGQKVEVTVAKENFLDKLKKERDNIELKQPYVTDDNSRVENDLKNEIDGMTKGKLVDNERVPTKKVKINKESIPPINGEMKVKLNKVEANSIPSKKLKIESVSKEPAVIINGAIKKSKSLDKYRMQADHKRVDSLVEKKKAYNLQKSILQTALSTSKINSNRQKIIFDDAEEAISTNGTEKGSHKKSLFDNDTDTDDDDNFKEILQEKEKFQGKSGEKLLKLQSKFKNDPRFKVNEKFLDEEEDAEDKTPNESEMDINLHEEKEKEIEILETILGHEVKAVKPDIPKSATQERKKMIRFDPSQPEHINKYEMKKDTSQKKKKEVIALNNKKVEQKENPEVSKERVYHVDETLHKGDKKENFSLLSTFGQVGDVTEDIDESPMEIEVKSKTERNFERNPFKYDSSGDDDDDEDDSIAEINQQVEQKEEHKEKQKRGWIEPFFYQEDDYRFQEGTDFVTRIAEKEEGDFSEVRNKIKYMVKHRIKRNIHKNRPFKTKLGSSVRKKEKRMKKALNR